MEKLIVLDRRLLDRTLLTRHIRTPFDFDVGKYFTLLFDSYLTLSGHGDDEELHELSEIVGDQIRTFCFHHSLDMDITEAFVTAVVENAFNLNGPLNGLGYALRDYWCDVTNAVVDETKVTFTTRLRPMEDINAFNQGHAF